METYLVCIIHRYPLFPERCYWPAHYVIPAGRHPFVVMNNFSNPICRVRRHTLTAVLDQAPVIFIVVISSNKMQRQQVVQSIIQISEG